VIEPEDFAFYDKIKVPPPTFCPDCRLQRRLAFWNVFALYKRKCDLCGKDSLSMYVPEARCVVYCPLCWYSDKWSALDYGKEVDFTRPFFDQLKELWKTVPLLGLSMGPDDYKTSPYNNQSGFLKNCYLMFDSNTDENCAYGATVLHSRDTFDCTLVTEGELCYDTMHGFKCNKCVGCRSHVVECIDCYFLKDCKNCQYCFGSANLRNAKYVMFNEQLTKEEYEKKLKEWDLGSYAGYVKAKRAADNHWKTQLPKPIIDDMSVDCTGLDVVESKKCQECYTVSGGIDSKYIFDVGGCSDSYDLSNFGHQTSWVYEVSVGGWEVSNIAFCQESGMSLSDSAYCKLSIGAMNHFGCVSVRNASNCILNKQYTPAEYESIKSKVKSRMLEDGEWGEFFPIGFSRHPYNDTIANDMFPLTKEEGEAKGYWYRLPDKNEYTITIDHDKLPDHIKDIPDSIVNEVIGCTECGKGFRIINMELEFLRRMGLPLPRLCPFCRIKERHLIWMKEMKQVTRTCDKCDTEFNTHYTEEEYPKILCKQCYQREVV
jgi:hypothetical protein